MFRAKIAIFNLLGLLFLFFIAQVSAQEFEEDFNIILEQAYGFQNISSDSVLKFANVAYSFAEEVNNTNAQLDALALIIKAQSQLGNYSNAILNCLIADSISKASNQLDRNAEVMMLKGIVYQNSGFVSEGLDYLFSAQNMIGNNKSREIETDLNYYIALAYYDLDEIGKCKEYVRRAIAIEQKENDQFGLMKNYNLLANSFSNIDSIQKYLLLAETIIASREEGYKKAALLNNKALIYKSFGQLKEAKSAYNKAITISIKNGYKNHLANIYNNYAYLLMTENRFDSAAIQLNKAIVLARELKDIDLEASILDSYTDYSIAVGDSARALNYYKNSVKLRNKYHEKQRIEQSLFLSTVFETEKKEKEIARQDSKLYRINTILFAVLTLFTAALAILIYFRQKSVTREVQIKNLEQEKKLEIANAMIEGQDAERKRLAMDLHDGISPRIGSLKLEVEKSFGDSEDSSSLINSIIELNHSVRDLSHKMLPSQLESHGLIQAVKNLVAILERSSEINFIFYTNINNRLNPKLETNLFFLSYELINNAVKHSKGTEINIQLLSDNQSISLSVEDDGKGFDPKIDFSGLGLKNIHQRASYLDGKLTIDTGIGQGTAIIIEIET